MAGHAATARRAMDAARQQTVVEIDPSKIAPVRTLDFTTYQVTSAQRDEVRDEDDKITTSAGVDVLIKEPPMIADLTGQVMHRGGQAYSTHFNPGFAIQVGEELAAAGRAALESMKEQPLEPVGFEIASSMADADAAARAAAAADQLKNGPAQ